MRKLLAMVATMAIVLSMFSGIAFADEASPEYELILNTSAVMASSKLNLQPVNGSLVNKDTGAMYPGTFTVTVTGEGVNDTRTSSNGSFTLYIPTNVEAQNLIITAKDGEDTLDTASLPVKYTVTLNDPLEYNYNEDEVPIAIIGVVTDSEGNFIEDAKVTLKLNGEELITDEETDSKGAFGKVVVFEEAGDLELYVNDVLHLEGEVIALGMSLTVSPDSGIVRSVADTKMTFTVDNGPTGSVTIKIYDSSDNEVKSFGPFALEDGYYKAEGLLWKPEKAGTFTVKATVGSTHSASATVEVVNPAGYNVVNAAQLDSMAIGTKTLTFGAGGIQVVRFDAEGVDDTLFDYVVTVDGKIVIDQRTDGELDKDSVEVKADELGTKTIRLQAYEGNVNVFDRTYTMNITGWDVTMDVKELMVGESRDITILIVNDKGVPVNNATIKFDGTDKITPSSSNIQDGTYVIKNVKYNSPTTVTVGVFQGSSKKVELTLNVVGQKVYDVTANAAALLLGKSTKVRLTVSENGTAFVPAKLMKQVGDGTPVAQAFTAVDTNKDGVFDAIDVTLTATGTEDITLRAENYNGTKCGEVVLEVEKAVLEVTENENLTENFKTKVTFSIINPIDGSVVKNNVTFDPKHVTIEVSDASGGVSGNTLLGAESYTVNILAKSAQWKAAEDAEEEVEVGLKVYGYEVAGTFPVAKATLTSDPAEVIIGLSNNLTITYADANGAPIVGKEVYYVVAGTDTLIAKTDDNGRVVHATTGSIALKAKTGVDGKFVEKTLNAVVDTKAPVVSAPETVETATAVITITDNVRIVRVMIDGVEDTTFFPGATYTKTVNLAVGANTFTVQAMDNNYNTVSETVTITRVAPTVGDKVVLQGDKVERQGEYLFVQIRQFEELGATFGWNDATKTATFVLDGKTVEVTVGSTTAVVDGENATMPVAPFIVAGRTFVPTRFIAEALGMGVHWQAGDIVTITK